MSQVNVQLLDNIHRMPKSNLKIGIDKKKIDLQNHQIKLQQG